jgi:sodium transport system permease protein
MRPSFVRLVAGKEIRDLFRDRRTLMLVLILPAVLYPLFGGAGFFMAQSMMGQEVVIGLSGADHLPAAVPADDKAFPPFLADGKIVEEHKPDDPAPEPPPLAVTTLTEDPEAALAAKRVDAVLVVPPGFVDAMKDPKGPKPKLIVQTRDGDEKSKLAGRRLASAIRAWEEKLRDVRFVRSGLPKDFDKMFVLEDPQTNKPKGKKAADELRDSFVRVFPFILIMWLVAGAVQPAVDMTAGERERGTMETLLISPASRTEIVAGKWLATTAFGFLSVCWNVTLMTIGAIVMEQVLGFPIVNIPGLLGCMAFGLPLAMLFSAVCIALGVFAKSTKEGQYYLVPLFLVVLPLAFGSMMPGTELTPGRAMIPITGAMLLQQKLLSVSPEPIPWGLVPVVLGSLAVFIALALWAAVRQFHRESVLFGETGGRGLWARMFARSK